MVLKKHISDPDPKTYIDLSPAYLQYRSCILHLPDVKEEVHPDLLQIIVGEVQVKGGGGQAAGFNGVRLIKKSLAIIAFNVRTCSISLATVAVK